MFSFHAWTVAFALLGALILSITVVPVLTTFLFRTRIKEFHNPLLEFTRKVYLPALGHSIKRPRFVLVVSALLLASDGVMA